jgi:hypothetical protein
MSGIGDVRVPLPFDLVVEALCRNIKHPDDPAAYSVVVGPAGFEQAVSEFPALRNAAQRRVVVSWGGFGRTRSLAVICREDADDGMVELVPTSRLRRGR